MVTHEYEALIHRYLDGELDASLVLRVEEHLRSSPESRAYLESLRQLDRHLVDAIGGLPGPADGLEDAVAWRLRLAAGDAPTPVREIDAARRRLRAIQGAAAVLIAALILQVGLLLFAGPSDGGDAESVDTLHRRIAALEHENSQLRSRRPEAFQPHPAPFDPLAGRPPAAPRVASGPGATGTDPDAGAPDVKSDKPSVLASIRDILSEFRSNGRWDLERQAQIMQDLAMLDDLTQKDFVELRHLFGQQDPYGPGQLFLAQVIGRFFTHNAQAREFVYAKVRTELDRIRRGGPGAMGDRVLRRAWTEGLAHARDRRSLDYLRDLGLHDPDWVNRENAMGALAHIGNAEAAKRLGELVAAERNAQLKEEGLRHLYDLIYSDPTVGHGSEAELRNEMLEILRGEFGESGEYFDSMVWALQILRALGGTTEEIIQQWRARNAREAGGDKRGAAPSGIPLQDTRQ